MRDFLLAVLIVLTILSVVLILLYILGYAWTHTVYAISAGALTISVISVVMADIDNQTQY